MFMWFLNLRRFTLPDAVMSKVCILVANHSRLLFLTTILPWHVDMCFGVWSDILFKWNKFKNVDFNSTVWNNVLECVSSMWQVISPPYMHIPTILPGSWNNLQRLLSLPHFVGHVMCLVDLPIQITQYRRRYRRDCMSVLYYHLFS